MAMALRVGVPLEDMEFVQFHPTGIAGRGMLITEGARGEGGFLVNGAGERFMERYAPKVKDLASRDVVSRAIAIEVREGRGCGRNKDHALLDLRHLGADAIKKRLPGIREMTLAFMGLDPIDQPIPVFPTCHYSMGGIPTNFHAQVVMPVKDTPEDPVPGLYAAGEAACVSVHGANRLGGNSLLDLLVFGRAAAEHMLGYLQENPYHRPVATASVEQALARLARWERKGDGETVEDLRRDLRKVMEDHCGVFRTAEVMLEGVVKLKALRERIANAVIRDHTQTFNTARVEALELENLMDCAFATMFSALGREESRGAHSRVDFPDRDDERWLKHSLYSLEGDQMDYKPVRTQPLTVESFPPKQRVY